MSVGHPPPDHSVPDDPPAQHASVSPEDRDYWYGLAAKAADLEAELAAAARDGIDHKRAHDRWQQQQLDQMAADIAQKRSKAENEAAERARKDRKSKGKGKDKDKDSGKNKGRRRSRG